MYVLSDRQTTALANLEGFINLRRGRTNFADRDEFQRYWDQLKKQCDQTALLRQTETPTTRRARDNERKAKVTHYYQDEERLAAYAHQYRVRYQPSTNKLRAQLMVKSANQALVELVMARVQEHLNDDVRAMELVERMRGQGRNVQFIQAKLSQRKFESDTIKRCLQTCVENNGSMWVPEVLMRKATQLKRKGLSRSAIRSKLAERPADAPLVDAALTELFAEEGDDTNLALAVAKLRRRNVDAQIITRRLQTKGFSFAAIKKALSQAAI